MGWKAIALTCYQIKKALEARSRPQRFLIVLALGPQTLVAYAKLLPLPIRWTSRDGGATMAAEAAAARRQGFSQTLEGPCQGLSI
jgi:hypothetical protein